MNATQLVGMKRRMTGMVVSDKMEKTIVVRVDRRVIHPLYKKYVVRSKNYKVHDQDRIAKTGDRVVIVESKPISRDKRWALVEIVRKADGRALQVAE